MSDDARADGAVPAFELVGGEPAVRALVDRFYDLMDLEPAYRELRALHPATLDGSRDKLHRNQCSLSREPQHYVERFGHPRLRARHLPFSIGIRERDQWMACMKQAMHEQGLDESLATRLAEAFFNTADWMRNRGGA